MDYQSRIAKKELLNKVMTAEQAAEYIKTGMTVAFSGFTSTGYPKAVPMAVAAKGEAKDLRIIAGASTGDELDGVLARAGAVGLRIPFNSNKYMRNGINSGDIKYADLHLSHLSGQVRSGIWGNIDVAVVECCAVLEDGGIVPTLSVGATDAFVEMADKVILELNSSSPESIIGLHDFFSPSNGNGGERCLPDFTPAQHLGGYSIPCDPDKIAAIVISDIPDQSPKFTDPDEVSSKIASHIIKLISDEIAAGRLPKNFTIQSGVGAVANAVLYGLNCDDFEQFDMYTEVMQDGALELMLSGKIREMSAAAFSLTAGGRKKFYDALGDLKDRMVLRPQDMSNHCSVIKRMGIVAMNTAIEADIYGNVNSTHIMGSGIMNGIGGSGDFARHGGLTIFMTPSTAKGGKISSIVPMVSHVDSTEHDVDIIVTEHGAADLRGKSPRERAEIMIECCCDPAYRPALRKYFEDACKTAPGQHTPHDLRHALEWHVRFMETGTML